TSLIAVGIEVYRKLTQPLNLKLQDYFNRPNYQEKSSFFNQFQADFKRVIDMVTQKGRWPLVIFIDDLDRCEPPKPVEIVEAINLLLDSKYCVFIIGMDMRTVASSIEAKYKEMLQFLEEDSISNLSFGQQFLEKIVQIRFRIPQTSPEKFEDFIRKHLVISPQLPNGPDETEQRVEQVAAQIKAVQRGQPKSAEEAAEEVKKAAPDTEENILEAAKEQVQADEILFDNNDEVKQTIIKAATYLGRNPRQIKRFINLYRLQAFIVQKRGLLDSEDFRLNLLGKCLILNVGWPAVAAAVRRDQDFIRRFVKAADLQSKIAAHESNERVLVDEDIQHLKSQLKSILEQNEIIAKSVDDHHLYHLLEDFQITENIRQYFDLTSVHIAPTEKFS
ncbi:MAG TPA: P-loop NTPase fold protein, partial [Anaerolineae bacterium]|nr:P-loop NTPase fold protein [Anaerolineae bacterium]